MSLGSPTPAAHFAAAALYEHRLGNLGRCFAARGLSPLIVKGQSVSDLAYGELEPRLASDVDLLVSDDESAVCQALIQAGYHERTDPQRRVSSQLLGERPFVTKTAALPPLVEVHRFLDKGILRPVDYAGIHLRAQPSGREGFHYPSPEDLLLLVVLHEAVSLKPSHARTSRDIARLLARAKPDMAVVRERARAWELTRALEAILAGRPPAGACTPGLAYLWSQRKWHDRQSTWAKGLLRYALARGRDRLG